MGWQDRSYYNDSTQDSPAMRLGWRWWSVTAWLVTINVAVFVVDLLLGRIAGTEPLWRWGHFSADTAVSGLQVWRFLTFQFLHSGVLHLVFNMLCIYFAGRFVENHLGSRRFLAFYLLSGVGGVLTYLALLAGGVLIHSPSAPLVGASAGAFGLLVALAIIAPQATVFMWPIPIPMSMRTLAWILIGIAVLSVIGGERNAGGEAAHLGGAAAGFLLFRHARLLSVFDRFSLPRRRGGTAQSPWQKKLARKQAMEQEVDRILAKVHRDGMKSLTRKERQTLQDASRD
jgi:membrane associated rhomboid family serine protease